jgi:malate synthase
LGDHPNQLNRQRPDVHVEAADLLGIEYPEDGVTPVGLRTNIDVGVRYIVSWLSGVGAAAIHDLMEDAATAEISRAQVWQWVRHGITLSVGDKTITEALVRDLLDVTEAEVIAEGASPRLVRTARAIFEEVALGEEFATFLTLPAYDFLD